MLNTVAEREAAISSGAEEKGMQLFAAVHMNTHFFGTLNNDTNITWVGESLCSIGLHCLQWQDAYMWRFIHDLHTFIMVTEVKKQRFFLTSKHTTFPEHSKMAKAANQPVIFGLRD